MWRKQDSKYLAATVASGAFAAYLFAANVGLAPAPPGGLERFGAAGLPLPIPLIASAPRAELPRERRIFVLVRATAPPSPVSETSTTTTEAHITPSEAPPSTGRPPATAEPTAKKKVNPHAAAKAKKPRKLPGGASAPR